MQDLIVENWKSARELEVDSTILDSEFVSKTSKLSVTLRIPWSYKGSTNHMLIDAELQFAPAQRQVRLSIVCNILKPLVIFSFFGFLTSVVFVLPYFIFPSRNLMVPVLAGLLISGVYFSLFYLKIQRISSRFIEELTAKYRL